MNVDVNIVKNSPNDIPSRSSNANTFPGREGPIDVVVNTHHCGLSTNLQLIFNTIDTLFDQVVEHCMNP